MMDRALYYLALARKAGFAELGEEPVGAAARAGHARLIVVASDASDHTWRRAKSFVAGTQQQLIRWPYSKDETGMAIGRTSLAVAAITDAGIAKSLVEALGDNRYQAVMAVLEEKAAQLKLRQKEAKAHQRNKRQGKHKPSK
ncbi:MAG: 50S ribosomal protein L7 [Ruminococcaceae bacterium]|nr:50S ribosomal protein L7 [Oscillospiraceae bacterium]